MANQQKKATCRKYNKIGFLSVALLCFKCKIHLQDNHEKRLAFAGSEGTRQMEEDTDEISKMETYDIETPDVSECKETIKLRGPYSPLEMRVYGITSSSLGKNVKVEYSSVNTVLLDAEPQDPHTR